MHRYKECPFSGVTSYSRIWRKGAGKQGLECGCESKGVFVAIGFNRCKLCIEDVYILFKRITQYKCLDDDSDWANSFFFFFSSFFFFFLTCKWLKVFFLFFLLFISVIQARMWPRLWKWVRWIRGHFLTVAYFWRELPFFFLFFFFFFLNRFWGFSKIRLPSLFCIRNIMLLMHKECLWMSLKGVLNMHPLVCWFLRMWWLQLQIVIMTRPANRFWSFLPQFKENCVLWTVI